MGTASTAAPSIWRQADANRDHELLTSYNTPSRAPLEGYCHHSTIPAAEHPALWADCRMRSSRPRRSASAYDHSMITSPRSNPAVPRGCRAEIGRSALRECPSALAVAGEHPHGCRKAPGLQGSELALPVSLSSAPEMPNKGTWDPVGHSLGPQVIGVAWPALSL